MSHYLKRFAKERGMKKDHVRSVRLPKEVADEFERHCKRYGLSFNEGVLHLILHELGKDKPTTAQQGATTEIQEAHNVFNDEHKKEHNRITIVSQTKPKRNTIVTRPQRKSSGFSIKDYEVDGKVPCPLCYDWYAYKNFSRHCKDIHGTGTREVIDGKEEIIKALYDKRVSN